MKTMTGHYYEVRAKNDYSGLCLEHYTNDIESFESVVNAIKKAEEQAEEKGYPDKSFWIIVCVEWTRTYDDDEMFLRENTSRTAVATYFDGVVEDI